VIEIPERIFITGTDTGVGKTVVTASLARCLVNNGLKVNVIKPFQTGCEESNVTDIEFIYKVMEKNFDIDKVCPFRLKKSLSPFYASKLENISYEISEINNTLESIMDDDCINLVEGAGGIQVPIMNNYFMSDLAKDHDLKVLIVARPGLGTVNHTLLTINMAEARGLDVLGIVVSNYPSDPDLAESTNISQLRELLEVDIIGIIPAQDNLDVESGKTSKLAERCQDFFIDRLGGNLNIDNFLT